MDGDLVAHRPCPFRSAAHSWQHVKTSLASEFLTTRIVRWGIGHPPQKRSRPSARKWHTTWSSHREPGTKTTGLPKSDTAGRVH